ncbi:hypothetical protein FRB99_000117 [Tulasnella sp. 403]|nr:hypothetical protein FRB99_000117 [Tulasnella sp. 403]
MSQTNPRKAVLRTSPNGAEPSSPAPDAHQQTQSSQRHPFPQHPHTHVPAHMKTASNRGPHHHARGRGGSKLGSPAPNSPVVEEAPELKALREKYGSKLQTLKEIYPDWDEESLLSVLGDSNGNVEAAATNISEGRAERWDSVSRKKDKKEKGASPLQQQVASRERSESAGAAALSASPRGSLRGGRGGGVAGRGGRGGSRGGLPGRGGPNGVGHAKANSAQVDATGKPVSDIFTGDGGLDGHSTTPGDGWLDTPTINWGTVNDVAQPATVDDHAVKESDNALSAPASAKPQAQSKTQASKSQPQGPPKLSWAQIAKQKPTPVTPAVPPVPPQSSVQPSTLPIPPPVQILQEPPSEESAASHEPELSDVIAPQEEMSELKDPEPSSETDVVEAWPEAATTAPSDDWIAVTPQNQIPVELPSVPAPEVAEPEPKPVETVEPPVAEVPAVVEPVPAPQPEPTPIAPPGLSMPASAPTPSLSTVSTTPSMASTVPATIAPSIKPSTPRLGSHRTASRFKTTDAPVVMPGGGLPTPVFGGLSFGNAVTGTGDFGGIGGSRFGMQFGSLSLNDDLDSSAPVEPPAPAPEPVVEQPAPVQKEESPMAAPVPVSVSAPPQPEPAPVVPQPAPAPQPVSQPVQQSPRVPTSGSIVSNINSLFQHQQPSSLPHQVTSSITPSPAVPSAPAPAKVDSLPQFGGLQGAPGLLNHLQQQQQQQPATQTPSHASHLPPHLNQNQQHVGSTPSHSAQQPQQNQNQQPPQQQQLPYSHQQLPHLDTTLPQAQQAPVVPTHPAVAAQSSYFRAAEASPYFHAPTPPQTQLSQPLQQDHSSPYGAFAPLGQQQQAQAGHLGGFGASTTATDYTNYDGQGRGFYDSYNQANTFQNRNQLGQEDSTKAGLPPTNPSTVLPGQQAGGLGQGQPGVQSALGSQQPFSMMPYHYYQQPSYHYPPLGHQYNPYSAPPGNPYKYGPPYSQPPAGPGAPPPHQQQANKPPTNTASPYTSQHYPAQNSGYDDPSMGYQQGATPTTDYSKQGPLYPQGLQNFFGGQSTPQNGPQLGGGQGQRAGANSSSPENPYKPYAGAPGVTTTEKAQQQAGGQGRGAGGPGPQPQQGGYYPNRYSGQPQPSNQGYPQTDGQFYPSYQQRPGQYW